MNKLRLGFVGAGTISLRLLPHFAVADTAERVEVRGICDPVLERAQAAVDRFAPTTATAFDSLEAMLAADEIDAVSICSPIGLHFEHAIAAIRAGKHIHVNKTLCVTVAEADQIIAEAAERDVRIVASPGEMLRPHNIAIKKLIQDGAIGKVSWALCGASIGSYHADEPERQGSDPLTNINPAWYFRRPGGGPLYDLTVYSLHGMTGILGPVERVTAMSGIVVPVRSFNGQEIETDADDNTLILLDFGGGTLAMAHGTTAGNVTPNVEFDFSGRYFGTEGEIRGLYINGQALDYEGRELAESAPGGADLPNAGGHEWLLPHVTEAHRFLPELHVWEDLMQMVDWALDGTPSIVTAEHARHVVDIIESAYRAAETGQTQELHTTF